MIVWSYLKVVFMLSFSILPLLQFLHSLIQVSIPSRRYSSMPTIDTNLRIRDEQTESG